MQYLEISSAVTISIISWLLRHGLAVNSLRYLPGFSVNENDLSRRSLDDHDRGGHLAKRFPEARSLQFLAIQHTLTTYFPKLSRILIKRNAI